MDPVDADPRPSSSTRDPDYPVLRGRRTERGLGPPPPTHDAKPDESKLLTLEIDAPFGDTPAARGGDRDTPAARGGDTPEGDTPEGDTPEGNTPEGNTPGGADLVNAPLEPGFRIETPIARDERGEPLLPTAAKQHVASAAPAKPTEHKTLENETVKVAPDPAATADAARKAPTVRNLRTIAKAEKTERRAPKRALALIAGAVALGVLIVVIAALRATGSADHQGSTRAIAGNGSPIAQPRAAQSTVVSSTGAATEPPSTNEPPATAEPASTARRPTPSKPSPNAAKPSRAMKPANTSSGAQPAPSSTLSPKRVGIEPEVPF